MRTLSTVSFLLLAACGGSSAKHADNPRDLDLATASDSGPSRILTTTSRDVATSNVSSGVRCRLATDPGSDAALSDDGSLVATMTSGRLTIWETRSCSAVRAYRNEGVRAIAFAGNTHDVIVLHENALERVAENGNRRATRFGFNVTRWAVSPDGRQIALGWDGTRYERMHAAVAMFSGDLSEVRRLRAPVDDTIDGIAFTPKGDAVIITQPVRRDRDGYPITHLATAIDTTTWKVVNDTRLGWGQPQRTLVVIDNKQTIAWGSLWFDRDGLLTHAEQLAWHASATGKVAVGSDENGYFVWSVDTHRMTKRLDTHPANEWPPDRELQFAGWNTRFERARPDDQQIPLGVAMDGTVLFCGGSTCDVI